MLDKQGKTRSSLWRYWLALCFLCSLPVQAQLAGKNVILVHGLQPGQLMQASIDDRQVEQDGANYWSAFWAQHADDRLDWSSKQRLQQGIAEAAYDKVIGWSRSGFCNQGCVIVTHSTGDLVTRMLLDQQEIWTEAAGLQPLNVLAVLDFAGAGGGSELAQLAIDVAGSNSWLTAPIRAAVNAFLGFTVTPEKLGVLEDLRPTVARQTAIGASDVPRLRFVGGGNEYLGVTGPFLPGTDDGVVSLHSACGGNRIEGIDSCVNYRALDGKKTSVSAPKGLYVNHYPVLMGSNTHHGGTIGDQRGVELSYAANNLQQGVNFSVATKSRSSGWWLWKSTYHTVKNSENSSMSEQVFNAVSL
ncbi:MAG: hypothetical protein MK185_03485 [Saccharospirillaceae bacterium]|nr:hypothetical protein A3759_17290 [Thalassolituus sp. HI0120]MCH2039681.1 hypothetical protein [Saccharospirillaceae bacterium]